ncbi:MAG: Sec-independent protein translocase subunit TatA/TatB [Fimbriiglobus sp.]
MLGLGFQELAVILLLGVVLFGRRLPEIGRSIGKTVVEFKKGMNGLEDELHGTSSTKPSAIEPEPVRPPQRVTTPSAPKFDDAPASGLPTQV